MLPFHVPVVLLVLIAFKSNGRRFFAPTSPLTLYTFWISVVSVVFKALNAFSTVVWLVPPIVKGVSSVLGCLFVLNALKAPSTVVSLSTDVSNALVW